MSGQPYSKEQQLARGTRRYHRKVASPKRWQAIIDAKAGPCRCEVLGCAGSIQWHHLVSRAQSGADTESNCVPLCAAHHQLVTRRDREASRVLLTSLTDSEYAYAVDKGGEGFFERAYGLRYERVT